MNLVMKLTGSKVNQVCEYYEYIPICNAMSYVCTKYVTFVFDTK